MKKLKISKIEKSPAQQVHDITVQTESNYVLENGVITHNSGLKYSASTIVYLSKRKVKEGTDVVGNIIHCKLFKSRLTKENSIVDVVLTYDKGLNPYYGLIDIGLKHEIFKKSSTKIEFPDGSKAFEKSIYANPTKYFTPEIMARLEEAVAKEFKYGSASVVSSEEIESEESVDDDA